MRKICLAIISAVLLLANTLFASAVQIDTIMPMYDNINSVYALIEIDESSGLTECTGMIAAKYTCPVSVTMKLQMKIDDDWSTLETWRAYGNWSATCDTQYVVYSGYEYRVFVLGYVYDNNGNIIESGSAVHEVNYPKQ